jgi:Na+/H+ antiporter NhaD/arsenite permease-like protein
MGPVALVALAVSLVYFRMEYMKNMKKAKAEQQRPETVAIEGQEATPDRRLLSTGLTTLVGAVLLFSLQDIVGIYPTVVALAAAVILLFVGGPKMPEILNDVEWSTLIFFASLFVVVGGLEKTGWMNLVAQEMSPLVSGSRALGLTAVLWIFSLASAILNNIPLAAAFIPVLKTLGSVSGLNVYPYWWALAAGTGLGGNGTIIGASSNVIAIGLARSRGVRITFVEFAKIGMVTLLLTTGVANLILLIRFWG